MKMSEIAKRIEQIKEDLDDDERAHIFEDKLMLDFIKYIAKRKDHLGKKAKAVLKTQKLNFSRYMG